MHRKVVLAVSVVLFGLAAFLVAVMTDLHDRSFPVNADVKASVSLDFSGTGLSDSDAFTFLARSSDQFDLGLVKLAPDLGADQSGQVLVPLGDIRLPERVQRFGDQPDAIVKDAATLEHSFASGQYLVSGSDDQLNTFRELLDRRNIGNEWALDSVTTTLTFLVRQSAFGVTLLATAILMISLALFWLTVKSRARALRILAGVSSARIQYEDITEFLVRLSAAAAAVWALATGYVGVAHGWAFTAYYSRTLALFMGLVVVTTAICMLLMCLAAWPSPQLLARREPAVSKYRAPSAALKAVTFILLLSAVAPSVTAYEQASNVAAQQAVWRSLSDQVSLVLPSAVDEAGFQALSGRIGDVIADAEAQHHLALSYTWAADADAGLNFGQEQNLSLVNQQWLDLVTTGSTVDQILLTPVAADELPPGMRNYLQANLPIWLHPTVPVAQALQQFTFYRQSGTTEAPMARAGGGGIAFLDSGVVMVAPRVHGMFTDDFLGSVASSMNLMFTGLGPTQQLLEKHELTGKLYVKRIAEEGVLLAQLTTYVAWLRALSAISLAIALLISAVIGAFIAATLQGRRNFPLRLAGTSWEQILRGPIAKEWASGIVLTCLVLGVQQFQLAPAVIVSAIGCLAISTLLTYRAAQWSFNQVTVRSM